MSRHHKLRHVVGLLTRAAYITESFLSATTRGDIFNSRAACFTFVAGRRAPRAIYELLFNAIVQGVIVTGTPIAPANRAALALSETDKLCDSG